MAESVREFIAENKRNQKQQLLDYLGLSYYEREYAPEEMNNGYAARDLGYGQVEIIDGKPRFYKMGKKIYPEITDDEYNELLIIANHKRQEDEENRKNNNRQEEKPVEFAVKAQDTGSRSLAAIFMRVNAFITWIGGLIFSIMASITSERYSTYSSKMAFSWTSFIIDVIIFFIVGCVFMCAAESYDNLETIKNELNTYHIMPKKK